MAVGLVTIKSNKVSIGIALIVIILTLSLACSNTQAQTTTSFTPADKFSIPEYNGIISFAANGTYFSATFGNNTWTFTNLQLTRSRLLENLEISTQNSNVTILSYATANNTEFKSATLRYAVEGNGKQTLNLNPGSGQGNLEWSVTFNNHFIDEGEGWSISHDGTIVVSGATGNVSLVSDDYFNNASGYQQHSVAIITAMLVAITVIIAVVVKLKNREHLNESELVKSA
jgi:hypothetical protein